MSSMEYKEVQIPKEILDKLEEAATKQEHVTLGDAGVLTWLTETCKDNGWRVVWSTFNFPYVVLEREVE